MQTKTSSALVYIGHRMSKNSVPAIASFMFPGNGTKAKSPIPRFLSEGHRESRNSIIVTAVEYWLCFWEQKRQPGCAVNRWIVTLRSLTEIF